MPVIVNSESVVRHARFLSECAVELGVPVIGTTQNAVKLGGFVDELGNEQPTYDKMSFSCMGSGEFAAALSATGRRHVIVAGVETHICVMQTCLDLLDKGFQVTCVLDAISSRTEALHKAGVKRLRDSGVSLSLCDSVVYEWMRTASHPAFRTILKKVISLDSVEIKK